MQFGCLDVPRPEFVLGAADAPTLHGTQYRALVDAARGGGLGKGVTHVGRLAAVKGVRTMAPPWLMIG
jgi:hypothetical protein